MEQPSLDVSLVVSTYQQAPTVGLTIESLLNQTTDASFEIIVCDDGSSSESFDLCRDLIQHARRPIYWVWQQDDGFRHAAAINNGIKLARGDYIVFLDGDMIPAGDFLQRHLEAHLGHSRLVMGNRLWRSFAAVSSSPAQGVQNLRELLEGQGAIDKTSKFNEYIERQLRSRMAGGGSLWQGAWLCNLSAPRSEAVYVDESFRGYGFEDMEMGYRLTTKVGLEPFYDSSIVAYHLATAENNPFVTKNQNSIVSYLRNFCYFEDKWPEALKDYSLDYLPYELDAASNTWQVTRFHTDTSLKAYLLRLRQWLSENAVYPPKAAELRLTA